MMKVLNSSVRSLFPTGMRQPNLPARSVLVRLSVVSLLSAAGLLSGLTPQVAQSPARWFAAAYAQGDSSVPSYASAAYQIERLRQKKFSEAKQQFPDGNVPSNVCQQSNIPAPVRSICDDFIKESADIIKSNGLTVAQFNDITRRKSTDTALQNQIDTELLRIQKKTP